MVPVSGHKFSQGVNNYYIRPCMVGSATGSYFCVYIFAVLGSAYSIELCVTGTRPM